jgi:hypothetical protein
MKQPINEIERLKLIAGLINEVNYTDAVYGVNRKTTLTEAKKEKTLHIDVANPYEFRHGLQYELDQMDDYSDEALDKAKVKVLKNLAKDANFYFDLLNQQPTGFKFKETETNAPGMQANADGTLKKGAGKLEKANVKDSLSKSEAAKGKPKGVKELTDKGVEGKEKVVKEGIDDKVEDMIKSGKIKPEEVKTAAEKAMKGDSSSLIALMAGIKLAEDQIEEKELSEGETKNLGGFQYFTDKNEWLEKVKELYPDYEKWMTSNENGIKLTKGSGMGAVNLGGWEENPLFIHTDDRTGIKYQGTVNLNNKLSQSDLIYPAGSRMDEDNMESDPANGDSSAEGQFNQLMSKYDWYHEMSDDSRKWDTGRAMDQKLKSLAKAIGVDRAVELFNANAPSDRKVTTTFFMEAKDDKHSKLKETLKKGLKELMSVADIQASKVTGKPINVSKTNTLDIKALQNAKANFTTYE